MESLCPRCPAARVVAGADQGKLGIVCGVLLHEGLAADGVTEGPGHEYLTAAHDPSIVLGFCCGTAVPPATPGIAKAALEAQGNYGYCPIWQQEKDRIEAAKARAWGGKPRYTQPESAEDFLARVMA